MKLDKTRKYYKAVHPDFSPGHDNVRFEVGETYSIPDDVEIRICKTGWHAHEDLCDVYSYYPEGSPVLEVLLWGDEDAQWDKVCARHMKVLRIVPAETIGAAMVESLGSFNLGSYNRGSFNRGDRNRGNSNRGNCNRGNCNRGSDNLGSFNLGICNRGDRNRGNENRGSDNRGDYNRGNYSWGIGCTGPTSIPCFDGALHVDSDAVPPEVYELARHPENDNHYQAVLELGAKPRLLAQWRKRFMEAGRNPDGVSE